MNRILLSSGILVAVAGGCTSTSSGYGFADAGPDATSIVADAGPADAKKSDAKADAKVVEEEDAGTTKKDAGPPPGTCAPGSVASFTPTWHPPARTVGACTPTQVSTILDCLLDPNANPTTCAGVNSAPVNQACIKCAVSESTDASYGPLISGNGIIGVNVAGCVALKTANVTAAGCGAKYQSLGECSTAACEPNCPVIDDASFTEYNKCTADAEANDCSSFATGAACADPLMQTGGAASACEIAGNPFIDNAKAYTTIFCGQ